MNKRNKKSCGLFYSFILLPEAHPATLNFLWSLFFFLIIPRGKNLHFYSLLPIVSSYQFFLSSLWFPFYCWKSLHQGRRGRKKTHIRRSLWRGQRAWRICKDGDMRFLLGRMKGVCGRVRIKFATKPHFRPKTICKKAEMKSTFWL